MAKKTNDTIDQEVMLGMPKPRLVKLIVKNFRCIGKEGVEIDLNDIVVLVGPNNAGKSSILKAYSLVMSDGSNLSIMNIKDFPNEVIDSENYPQIELHTIVYDDRVGKQWLKQTEENEWLVREKWTWEGLGKPKRQGWDYELGGWHESSFPFGPAPIANLRRPQPHTISAFDNPDDQAKEIKNLIMTGIKDRIKNLQQEEGDNDYQKIVESLKILQNKIIEESKEQIETANFELTSLIEKVFPGYEIKFDAKPEENVENSVSLFKTDAELFMGPKDGYQSSILNQGSGARRTLLWTALKFINDTKSKAAENKNLRPNLLLIDEPEICLHPNAIREASKVLYELPKNDNWQVMATTHSPVFIDFSKDNTTIVRVERNNHGTVRGTTIFRPEKIKLDEDDKRNLKILNLCDPYVAEFFFGGKVIIVEGDTEFTAFNYLKNLFPEKYNDLHIIRARGKATIISLVKILNQFGTDYSILHDSDLPMTKKGDRKNPAWGVNPTILEEVNKRPENIKVRLLASLPNFEQAYFGEEVEKDKPYNALNTINQSEEKRILIETLLEALIDHEAPLPDNCVEWNSMEELDKFIAAIIVNPTN